MDGIYAIASSSSSVTYGNIASYVKEMLIRKFRPDFFKYVSISTELAYRNFRRQLLNSSNDEITKRKKPWLIIKPRIEVPSGDMYLYDIPLTKNYDNIEYGVAKSHLFPFIDDKDNGCKIMFKINRDQMIFDVTITVSTFYQQVDLYKAMMNQFVWNRPFTEVASLEAMIPRDFINTIGKVSKIDVTSESNGHNMIPILIQHLNKYSQYPITYKMRNSTSLDEFYMYYTTEVLLTFSDLDIDEGIKKNMVDDVYNINFRVTAEFNLPGVFLLGGSKPEIKKIYIGISENSSDQSKDYVPLYTFENLYDKYKPIIGNFRLHVSSIFQTEPENDGKTDILDISPFFEEPYVKVLKQNYANNLPMYTLIKIIVIKDSVELVENTDWIMDWNTLSLKINNANHDSTYRFLIYYNTILLNERVVDMVDDSKTDKPKLK